MGKKIMLYMLYCLTVNMRLSKLLNLEKMGKGCHFGVNRRSEVRLHGHCWLVKCSSTNFSVTTTTFHRVIFVVSS